MSDQWHDIRNRSVFDLCPDGTDENSWIDYRRKLHRAESLEDIGHPIQIDIELNGGCNMACPFCTHGYEKIPDIDLPVETFKRLVSEALSVGVRSLKMNYINEPLLRNDLEDLISYSIHAGMLNVYLVTNGSLLKSPRRSRLINSGLTKLFISIDATTPETYGRQRLNGLFEKVCSNVESFILERNELGKRHPLVNVSFLINQINEHEAEDFGSRWSGVADSVSFQTMNEVPGRSTGLTTDQDEPISGCRFPFKQIVVDHRGSILPCCKLAGQEMTIGHVGDTSIAEAWSRSEHLRKLHAGGDWDSHPICSKCMRCEG